MLLNLPNMSLWAGAAGYANKQISHKETELSECERIDLVFRKAIRRSRCNIRWGVFNCDFVYKQSQFEKFAYLAKLRLEAHQEVDQNVLMKDKNKLTQTLIFPPSALQQCEEGGKCC